MSSKKYKSPPIVEALCGIRFDPGPSWDLTIPGKLQLQKGIEEFYTGTRQQSVIETSVHAPQGQKPNVEVREALARVQLLSEDGTRLISVGPDILSVNTLKPYDSWEDFKPRIESVLKAYYTVAKPKGINRIGVRYINRISIKKADAKINEYFQSNPFESAALPNTINTFMSRVEYEYEDGVKLILTHAKQPSDSSDSDFLLDLDVIWDKGHINELKKAMDVIEDLHTREGDAFEAMITDQARALFDDGTTS